MKQSRAVSILLSLVTALSLCVYAFALPPEEGATIGNSGKTLGGSGDETLGVSLGISNVRFPEQFSFIIDPFELTGRGQVFSDPLEIVNDNESPVLVELNVLADGEDVIFSSTPVLQNVISPEKELHLELSGPDGNVTIGDSGSWPIRFTLGATGTEGAVTVFEITGSANPSPAEPWREGDARLRVTFAVAPVPNYIDDGCIPEKEELVFDDE